MDNLIEIKSKAPRTVNREHLMSMAKDLVRKDYELIRIQDSFLKVFRDAEFYSKPNDDLSSLEQTMELATGEIIEEGQEDIFWGLVCDCGIAVAFDYKRPGVDEVHLIERNAEKIVELIFKATNKESDLEKQQVFIEGFETEFPHLSIPFLERRRMELNDGVSCQMH